MASPRTSRRGLRHLRTQTTLALLASKPSLTYLRIGALEMERARRRAERDNAVARIRDLDARCREIDAEKDGLLRAIGERRESPAERAEGRAGAELGEPGAGQEPITGGNRRRAGAADPLAEAAAGGEAPGRGARRGASTAAGRFRIRY